MSIDQTAGEMGTTTAGETRSMREATIHIPNAEFEKVGLGGFVSLLRDGGLRDVGELVCRSDGCLLVITVDDPVDEAALDALDRVEWWERIGDRSDAVVYLCKLRYSTDDGDARPMYNPEVSNDEIRVDGDGLDVTLVGSQDAIAREIGEYEAAGMTVLLERLGAYEGPRDTLAVLTNRQREVIETAHERGYFDVPRTVSTADLADELDLDPSTVSEHLQRAERNLVTALLESP